MFLPKVPGLGVDLENLLELSECFGLGSVFCALRESKMANAGQLRQMFLALSLLFVFFF